MNPRARTFAILGLVAGFVLVVVGLALVAGAGVALTVAGALLLLAGVDMVR